MEERIDKTKNIKYSKKFLKSLKRLSDKIIDQAEEKEKIFKNNPFDFRLKTHKLHGKEKEIWYIFFFFCYVCFFFLKKIEKNIKKKKTPPPRATQKGVSYSAVVGGK